MFAFGFSKVKNGGKLSSIKTVKLLEMNDL